jgi:glycosyltransferase involved in cell wall biosynthesis
MKLSVCMATFNGEKFLTEQLESILPQLAAEDELIISDDSSTDKTLAIIESLRDQRVQVYTGNTFFNPLYNFENALKRSRGEIIVLADQDDVWLEGKLEVVKQTLARRLSTIYTVVLDGYITDEQGDITSQSIFETIGSGTGILKNLYDNTYMGCCMAFTRELLEIALPFPTGIPMHDSWLGLLSESYGTVDFVPVKTIRYRRHAGNRSFQPPKTSQQIKWRYFLALNLLKRRLGHRRTTEPYRNLP